MSGGQIIERGPIIMSHLMSLVALLTMVTVHTNVASNHGNRGY